MSEEGTKKHKGQKINRISKAQAKAVLANCEKSGDTSSDYYLLVKKVAEGK